ncbi:hypothetical protein CAEBREN_22966 [Caenorhabditis brenneri]|uniref:Uncharacterized protein n=1 Tax=Caenorhabditis brenneri TaxID=135651 RepID=G0MB33_CAEBE|nr:hypothetical protein CAEBREN_22966 [Caenorhabditis brenneri]
MPPPTSRSPGRFYALTALIIIFSLLRRTRRQATTSSILPSPLVIRRELVLLSNLLEHCPAMSSAVMVYEYEIAVRIVHNCCDPSKPYRNLEVFVGNFKNEEVHYQKDIGSVEIHNKGNQTKYVIGKKKKKKKKKKKNN